MARKVKYNFTETNSEGVRLNSPSKNKKETGLVNKVRNYVLKPKTPGQQILVDSIYKNKITICNGPAGSGKGHISTCIGIEMLLAGQVEKLIITRPLVTAGEEVGILPGSIQEKLEPFLISIFEELNRYITDNEIKVLMNQKKIEIVPFGFMRGRNFINSFVIADEIQNVSSKQLKMLLTRFGQGSTMVLIGDTDQSDLKKHQDSGLNRYFDALREVKDVGIVELTLDDIVREGIIVDILKAIDKVDKSATA